MKRQLTKLAVVLLAIVMAFSLAACSSGSGEEQNTDMGETISKIKKEGKIVMGVNATYAPFEFHKTIDGEDKIVGFDIELGQAIADELGI